MVWGFCWGFSSLHVSEIHLWERPDAKVPKICRIYLMFIRRRSGRKRLENVKVLFREKKQKKNTLRAIGQDSANQQLPLWLFEKALTSCGKVHWKVAKGAPGLDHIKITKRAGFLGYIPRLIPRFPSGQKTFRCGRGKNTERNRTKIQNQFSSRQHLTHTVLHPSELKRQKKSCAGLCSRAHSSVGL